MVYTLPMNHGLYWYTPPWVMHYPPSAEHFCNIKQVGYLETELTGRAILIGDQTSDTHVTAKLEPWQTYFHETVTN